ncbi:enoyl-CoA hydratase [Variovorax sp. J22R133]|uniref:enoyl-CoA hydratase n=1 Tax=Variovorax brevis TaxID=3053503 RepID=UPI0025788B3C|nr:enoyl-CoA hydratase [Variovorax sp. J22R133]MDM0117848.1 enoyl-CoA hydratase [Variovorax sp. J22R133]
MTDHVTIDSTQGVLTITLARPEKMNAITNAMYGAMADALAGAESDPSVRVVLIRAEGAMFTAGNDLGEFAAEATGEAGPGERQVVRFLRALAGSTLPLVAAVNGRAVGVGTTMLLHCDLVLLAEDALLSTPFVNLALVPEAASSLLLPARIGHVRAFEMFALGKPISAAQALAWGIANRVVPTGALHDEAQQVAQALAKQAAGSLRMTKILMRQAEAIAAQMDRETAQFTKRLKSPEAREAFAAFGQKRPPDFSSIAG